MTVRKLKGAPQRRFRIEEIWYSDNPEASKDLGRARNGFLVVEQKGLDRVAHVFFHGLKDKATARRLRKKVMAETHNKIISIMHKVKGHEEPIGWVV